MHRTWLDYQRPQTTLIRSVSLSILVLLTLVVQVDVVQGGCGDYVVIGQPRTAEHDSQNAPEDTLASAPPSPLPRQPTPCHHGQCRQGSGGPAPAAPHLVDREALQKADLQTALATPRIPPVLFADSTAAHPLPGMRSRIDRPPQV